MIDAVKKLWHHLWKKARSRVDLVRFLLSWGWALLLGGVVTVVGLYASWAEPPNADQILLATAFCALIGVGMLARDTRRTLRSVYNKHRVGDSLDAARVRAKLPAPGQRLNEGINASLVYDDPVLNAVLDGMTTRIRRAPKSYSLEDDGPPGAWAAAPRLLLFDVLTDGRHIFNDAKVRLPTSLYLRPSGNGDEVGPAEVKLQRTDYFSGRCTNELVGERVVERIEGREREIYTPFEALHEAGQLVQLENSHMSNHIGVSTLAFTKDGELVVLQQSKLAKQPFWRTCETVSAAVERLGVRTMLLGFARFVHRGGKPEFFGLTFIDNAALSDIRTRGEEVLFQERAGAFTLPRAFPDTRGDQLEALCEGVERFEAAEGPRMSPSLQMNLLFLREHLVRRRDDGRKLLG